MENANISKYIKRPLGLSPVAAGVVMAEEILSHLSSLHTIAEGGSKKFLDVKNQLSAVGMHIHKTVADSGDEFEVRVVPHKDRRNKDLGYFTNDLEDALHTGLHIGKSIIVTNKHGGEWKKETLKSDVTEVYDNDDDRSEFANPGGNSALRRATKSNPRIHPCPTCKTPNQLTPKDKRLGYQCDRCADRDEGGFGYFP